MRSSSSEDSSDSEDNLRSFSGYGAQSKTEQFGGASCSRKIDSDSSSSDDLPPKAKRKCESNETSGNKGMSLMVISFYLYNNSKR